MNARETVEAYLRAFYAGDLDAVRPLLAETFRFKAPAASFDNAEKFLKSSGHAAKGVSAVTTQHLFVDGEDVCIFYALTLRQGGTLEVAEWHHLEGGRIASIDCRFDTAPFMAGASAKAEEAAVDPVCHMSVQKRSAAATRTHQGVTYYFCNVGCAESFEQKPELYLAG